jgi:hypothetical protein
MQDPPPRRTRRRPPGGPNTSLPLIPILIGVIVLGFVIGAGLSLFGKGEPAIVSVTESPSAAATVPPPSALADTPPPLPSPTPRPQSPVPRRSVLALRVEPRSSALPAVMSASPAAATTPALVANSATEPAGAATATAGTAASDAAATTATPPTPVPAEAPGPAGAANSPRVTPGAPAGPNAAAAREPLLASATPALASATPAEAPPAAAPVTSQSRVAVSGSTTPFARLAASVVRVYLSAVARGDRDSAAAELAAPPAGALVEESVVDGATQVRAVEVHGTGDIVTVNVDLKTAAGPYSAQFTVEKSPTGAALIADHSIIKS